MTRDFDNCVINLHCLSFREVQGSYTFADLDKAIASLKGSIFYYFKDQKNVDALANSVESVIRANQNSICIPIIIDTFEVLYSRMEFDSKNRVAQALINSFDQVDEQTQEQISLLFTAIEV